MVYEGRRGAGTAARRRARAVKGKRTRRPGRFFSVCAWTLFVLLAASLAWPDAAAKVREKTSQLVGGPDIRGAAQVFGESLGAGSGFTQAVREAWTYAFSTDKGGEVPAYAGKETQGDVSGGGEENPEDRAGKETATAGTAEAGQASVDAPEDPVAAFKESQKEYADLGLPKNVTYDMPEAGIDLEPPVEGPVTSGFGYRVHPADGEVRFHYGVDIASAQGTQVRTAAAGEVTAVGDSTSYGQYVIIRHTDGAESLYAHMESVTVTGGSAIGSGETIGTVGATGNATSPCLHMELVINGDYVNPEYYLNL